MGKDRGEATVALYFTMHEHFCQAGNVLIQYRSHTSLYKRNSGMSRNNRVQSMVMLLQRILKSEKKRRQR